MKLRDDGRARVNGDVYSDRSLRVGTVLLMRPSAGARFRCEPAAPQIAKWRFQATSPRSAHDSRIVLMSFLRQYAAADADLFTTELILGELLTNTVEHAPGPVDVHIDWADDQPTIRVRDTGRGVNAQSSELPQNLYDESGRGLFLITTLAPDVHIGPASGGVGTEITVRLPISRAKPPATDSPAARAA
jgi:anti-sigma regulatory factor (Ser/Thr protein kinase)